MKSALDYFLDYQGRDKDRRALIQSLASILKCSYGLATMIYDRHTDLTRSQGIILVLWVRLEIKNDKIVALLNRIRELEESQKCAEQ